MRAVEIADVGPRDGFQSIQAFIPTQRKIEIIEGLVQAGVRHIMLTSFVSPKAIPQLRDAAQICAQLLPRYPDVDFFALPPNRRGVADAWAAGLRRVSYVISVSESHNQANLARSVDISFRDLAQIRAEFPQMHICLDVATAFGCPFEGILPLEKVLAFVERGVSIGVDEFNLCDTVGLATPQQVQALLGTLIPRYPGARFDVHIHDTRNLGILNTMTAIQCGAAQVQTALGGLGGCPFAPGASGNTATEDLVYLLDRMGYETGINFEKLLALARLERRWIDGNYSGHQLNITAPCCVQGG